MEMEQILVRPKILARDFIIKAKHTKKKKIVIV